jgi:hypothetical protein
LTEFLGSVERRFSVPADFLTAVARSLGQDWPQATGEAGAQRRIALRSAPMIEQARRSLIPCASRAAVTAALRAAGVTTFLM